MMTSDYISSVDVASKAYLALLKCGPYYRTRVQDELCLLRDFIAQRTGQDAQEIQDLFEAQITGPVS